MRKGISSVKFDRMQRSCLARLNYFEGKIRNKCNNFTCAKKMENSSAEICRWPNLFFTVFVQFSIFVSHAVRNVNCVIAIANYQL